LVAAFFSDDVDFLSDDEDVLSDDELFESADFESEDDELSDDELSDDELSEEELELSDFSEVLADDAEDLPLPERLSFL